MRERREDIPLLANFFLKEAVDETASKVIGISDVVMNIFAGYEWPGNIRQLRNAIRAMVVMSDRNKLDVQDLPPEINRIRQLPAGQSKSAAG